MKTNETCWILYHFRASSSNHTLRKFTSQERATNVYEGHLEEDGKGEVNFSRPFFNISNSPPTRNSFLVAFNLFWQDGFCPCQLAHICHPCQSSLAEMDTTICKVFAHKNNRESKTNKHQQIQQPTWSYLSPPPPPAVVYLFLVGAFFCTENAKFWPILSIFLLRIYALLAVLLQG